MEYWLALQEAEDLDGKNLVVPKLEADHLSLVGERIRSLVRLPNQVCWTAAVVDLGQGPRYHREEQ